MTKVHTEHQPITFDTVREIVSAMAEVEEGTSYGTPAFKVRRRLLARLKEDGETLVVPCSFTDRDFLVQAEPEVFFFTDHYRDYELILIRLPMVGRAQLQDMLDRAWKIVWKQGPVKTRKAKRAKLG